MKNFELQSNQSPPASYAAGFEILARKSQLKLDFDAQGISGLTSFMAACIASGINTMETILDEVTDITSLHIEPLASLLLMEGENIHWTRERDGTFGIRVTA